MAIKGEEPHQWIIEDFDELLDPEFTNNYVLSDANHVRWKRKYFHLELCLIINGARTPDREWISLEFKLLMKNKRLVVNPRIWMVTDDCVWIRMNHDMFITLEETVSYKITNFLSIDGLYQNFEEYLPDNSLILYYDLQVKKFHSIPRNNVLMRRLVQQESRTEFNKRLYSDEESDYEEVYNPSKRSAEDAEDAEYAKDNDSSSS